MDIEMLKELSKYTSNLCFIALSKLTDKNARENVVAYGEGVKKLIDEAIARQSMTSEEVQEAIEYFEDTMQFISGEPQEKDHRLAITALQAYQPWVSVSERLPTRADADRGGYVLTRFSDRAIESWKWDEIASWNEDNNRSICKLAAITHWRPMLPEPPKGE